MNALHIKSDRIESKHLKLKAEEGNIGRKEDKEIQKQAAIATFLRFKVQQSKKSVSLLAD